MGSVTALKAFHRKRRPSYDSSHDTNNTFLFFPAVLLILHLVTGLCTRQQLPSSPRKKQEPWPEKPPQKLLESTAFGEKQSASQDRKDIPKCPLLSDIICKRGRQWTQQTNTKCIFSQYFTSSKWEIFSELKSHIIFLWYNQQRVNLIEMGEGRVTGGALTQQHYSQGDHYKAFVLPV